ncbi:MAG: prolyl oligopeptidase family serine peptidase [Melioribacteraceae bacterium]|nr:prolyl oligopeptidase family serine peptidase [Melioribacteraceae bacterium]
MSSKILFREKITLEPIQEKMISNGWGEDVIKNTITEKIIYESDGLKIKGYISYPIDNSKKFPCIIWCRGGVGDYGAIDEFNARGIFGQIASWGYVVFSTQYRGNDGSEGRDEIGGADINDVLNLIPLADEIQNADKNIWGIEGWSRGGMMTYLCLTKTNLFKAAVTVGAISNLDCENNSTYYKYLENINVNINEVKNLYDECYNRSVINFPEKISTNTNLLIIHGLNDEIVSPNNSIELSKKLNELKFHHKIELIEEGDHFLKNHREIVNNLKRDWYKKYLQ